MWRSLHSWQNTTYWCQVTNPILSKCENKYFPPNLYLFYQSGSCCHCVSRLYPKLIVFEHIYNVNTLGWIWFRFGEIHVLVQYDATLSAEEQSESSVDLQHWCMIIGCGAVISAGIALSFITKTYHPVVWHLALGCCTLLASRPYKAIEHTQTTPRWKKCNEASQNKLQQTQRNMIAWENLQVEKESESLGGDIVKLSQYWSGLGTF